MNERLKKIIFKKLYKDLSHVKIIPFRDSIWFIGREKRYWYFEYTKKGILWWRWGYFNDFFTLFSIESEQFQLVLSEWMEEVLNCKVDTPGTVVAIQSRQVEEVLNCKVDTPMCCWSNKTKEVEEVLNCKVDTPLSRLLRKTRTVEEVLNCKVITPNGWEYPLKQKVEEVLNNT